MGHLLGGTAGMILAEVLVEDGLEGEALTTDVAVEGLVPCVLTDVVLKLVLAGVLLPTNAAHERCDAHVKAHMAIQTSLLVEGLAAVNAGQPWVVAEPAVTHLFTQVLFVASHIKDGLLLSLSNKAQRDRGCLDLKPLLLYVFPLPSPPLAVFLLQDWSLPGNIKGLRLVIDTCRLDPNLRELPDDSSLKELTTS